jgi:WD40 repeat protein
MDPARWNRIEQILQDVLDLGPSERRAFLDRTCAGDDGLRREVENLLAQEDNPIFSHGPHLTALPSSPLLNGQRVSHYRIEKRIGAGGMGEVYEAWDENLQRLVALKLLPEVFLGDPDRVRRFEQEALSASRLNHPNIVTILEIFEDDRTRLIAAERIDGHTLRELLVAPLPVEKALDIAIQIASALKAAHTAWIIHRDIKPENVMVRADGLVKVLDFGIAKLTGEPADSMAAGPHAVESADLTVPGAVLGTASYMSPEQARGEPLDGRTDLFSLGLILYEMVTGERLLPRAGRSELLREIGAKQDLFSQRARLEKVPRELEPIIRRLLRSDRDARYGSASELLEDLQRTRRRIENRTARRVAGFSAAAVAAALVVVGIAAYLSVSERWDEHVLRDGHTAAARQAVFSPDGSVVVSCGEDGQVIVWDFARRQRLRTLSAHPAHKLAYAPNGRWLATGGAEEGVVIWDTRSWSAVRRLASGSGEVGAITFSPDSSLLAVSSSELAVWRTSDWNKVQSWHGVGTSHGTSIVSPAGDHLLTTSHHLTVVDLEGSIRKIGDQNVSVNWMAVSPDHTRLAGIASSGDVRFWELAVAGDLHDVRLESVNKGHQDHGRSIAFSPDGALVASAADDIVLWDAVTKRKVARFEYPSIVWSVAFSPDGRWLLSAHGDGAVLVWDVAERVLVAGFNEHSRGVRAVAFSPDGKHVASGSEDRSVVVWNVETGRRTAVLVGHDTRVMAVSFLRNGRELTSLDQSGVVKLWDVAKRRVLTTMQRTVDPQAAYCLAVSPDEKYFATTTDVWDRSGRTVRHLIRHAAGQMYGLDFSADGRILVTASTSGDVTTWSTPDFRKLVTARVPDTQQIAVCVSPDGKLAATGEDQGAVRLWRLDPLRQIAVLGRHAARVKAVTFSPDGRTVASAGDDKMIALWDVRSRKMIRRVGTHASPVYALAFSPDGRRLASGEHDHSVRVYTRTRSLWGMSLE